MLMCRTILMIALCVTATYSRAGAEEQHADLILRNGHIVTVDKTLGDVQAIAVAGTHILAVGTDAQMLRHVNADTRVIDLEGKLAIPGFIEGHGHFLGLGTSKMNLELAKAKSWDDIVAMVADAVTGTAPGEWIVGRGWHQEKWTKTPDDNVKGFPTHDDLSAVSPDNPVLLTHASGHACMCNQKAMDLAGISGSTADPPGGEIFRNEMGLACGIFNETAQRLIYSVTPSTRSQRGQAFDLATQACLENGITSFHDAGSTFDVIDTMVQRARAGTLDVRLWVMIRESMPLIQEKISSYNDLRRLGNDMLTIGGLKRSLDGALGSRGAWLLEPYVDAPDTTGLATDSIPDLETLAGIAIDNKMQLCIHAIGDRANRETLDLFERAFKANPDSKDLRWRIEHAQHIHPDDIPRFGQLGVIPAMQGVHCTSDGPWVYKRLGIDRARTGAYMWQSLMKTGAIIANGTDTPVEDISAVESFYASVTRRLADGTVFFPDQRMTRREALRSYTINAAYAAFEDDIKGTLTPGKLADIVVLSRDILTIPAEQILATEVEMTILGGQVVYTK